MSKPISPYNKALDLLSRREHSAQELRQKLKTRGFSTTEIAEVLKRLQVNKLQSDRKYTEAYTQARQARGVGPIKLAQELNQRGVEETLIAEFINQDDTVWSDAACEVREKKFGTGYPSEIADRARQTRFLQMRGFTHHQIKKAIAEAGEIVQELSYRSV